MPARGANPARGCRQGLGVSSRNRPAPPWPSGFSSSGRMVFSSAASVHGGLTTRQSGRGEAGFGGLRRHAEFQAQAFAGRCAAAGRPRRPAAPGRRWRGGFSPDTTTDSCRSAISRRPRQNRRPAVRTRPSASNGGSIRTRPRRSFGGTKAGSAVQPSRSTTRAWVSRRSASIKCLRAFGSTSQAVMRSCGRSSARAISGDPG